MKPLFSRLYDVLARSSVHQREDYLTEIFAECLESEAVAERVLTLVLGDRDLGIAESHADTQRTYRSAIADRKDDRPDVMWRLEIDDGGGWLVFIECKLKAPESGEDQLDRYARRLAKETADTDESPLLVYLTERADPREDCSYERHGIKFAGVSYSLKYPLHLVVGSGGASDVLVGRLWGLDGVLKQPVEQMSPMPQAPSILEYRISPTNPITLRL